MLRCISLYSYIKPQRYSFLHVSRQVVYLYIPTSNHNGKRPSGIFFKVVYLYIPTSNHNQQFITNINDGLYIFIFLHQTTTAIDSSNYKAQLYIFIFLHQTTTHPNPGIYVLWLYIFIFLHQTTTAKLSTAMAESCISLYSYIKPQPKETNILIIR